MAIPYRTARVMKRTGIVLLVLMLVSGLILACWFLWLQRFVAHSRDGAKFDMSYTPDFSGAQLAVPPEPAQTVSVYYNEGENVIQDNEELAQFVGYYANKDALEKDVEEVFAQIKALPKDAAIMVDVKSPKGSFFYSSSVSNKRNPDVDTATMDALIEYLDDPGIYAIARIPALRDYEYGLNHVLDGLPVSGGYLWADDDYCYWLDPSRQGTLTYLLQIVTELKNLGFDEVVLDEFRFPDTDAIIFNGDRQEALSQAAKSLVSAAADTSFTVSFVGGGGFTLPEGRCRLYMTGVAAADAAKVAQESGIPDADIRLVFLTEVHDTRFDEYCVLRPLDAAH